MTQYWIEQLQFSVEVFDERGDLIEVLARLHDPDPARAAYGACCTCPRAGGYGGGAIVMLPCER